MADFHNGGELDWDTYKALVQVVKDKRLALITERENPDTPEYKRSTLLAQQMLCSELHAEMMELVMSATEEPKNQNGS
jgi:hypothetical protein